MSIVLRVNFVFNTHVLFHIGCVCKGGRIYLCGGHGQEGGDPQGDPGRNRLVVDPEGEPRDEDDHGGRHVDCQDEEGQLPWF